MKGSQTRVDANKDPHPKKHNRRLEVEDIEIEEPMEPCLPLHTCVFNRLMVDDILACGRRTS